MMKLKHFSCIIFCFFLSISLNAQSQEPYIKHSVQKGETIQDIAMKYQVTPYDIYRINPDSRSNLKEKMVLLIPSKAQTKSISTSQNFVSHKVVAQETFYGISQKYGVSIELIQEANKEILDNGLQPGQILKIPQNKDTSEVLQTKKEGDTLFHIIKPQETAFSLSKQYGLTIQKLEELNPSIKNGFNAGEKIVVRINQRSVVSNTEQSKPENIEVTSEDRFYEIKPKETLFGLSKSFKVTQAALIELNPELKNGVREGMRIKIPAHAVFTSSQNQIADLTKTIKKNERIKELVVLLPFNVDKLESDSLTPIQNQFKKDPFLSMTLDLYSGVLMAIDSARALGIQMKVSVLDSKENKNTSDVTKILNSHNWQNTGVVIGPLYPHAVEQTAQFLSSKNIPVISPLRETNKSFSNLYQSMPTSEHARQTIFQYIVSKNASILAAIDANRGSTRQFLTQKGGVNFIAHDEKGQVSQASLNALLKKNVTNYVVLDSKKTLYILGLLNALIEKSNDYDIRLVSLEKNDALDFDEISVKKLARLHLTYPSITNEIETAAALKFYQSYRNKFNAFPSQFAIRGFDVSLDAILRMAQSEGFTETSKDKASEQISNKFDYISHINGFVNQGVYIFEYQEDLTIKLAE
jgi:LysM repeat protein